MSHYQYARDGFIGGPNPASHIECSGELTSEVTKAFKLCFLNVRLKSMQAALHTDYYPPK